MKNVKDNSVDENEPATSAAAEAPALDGSVDALVANLRLAREQLAELLEAAGKSSDEPAEDTAKGKRSAA